VPKIQELKLHVHFYHTVKKIKKLLFLTHVPPHRDWRANDSRNYAPTNEDDTCPMSKFCNTASVPKVQNQHHFGCPTYVLRKEPDLVQLE